MLRYSWQIKTLQQVCVIYRLVARCVRIQREGRAVYFDVLTEYETCAPKPKICAYCV